MSIEIRCPEFPDAETQVALVCWLREVGEAVRAGEALAELEIDKSSLDLEAPEDGILASIVVPDGTEGIQGGELLAIMYKRDEETDDTTLCTEADASVLMSTDDSLTSEGPVLAGKAAPPEPVGVPCIETHEETRATSLARSMAARALIDLDTLVGTGKHGRVTKADVEAALVPVGSRTGLAARPKEADATPRRATRLALGSTPEAAEILHSRARKIVAQRMLESKRTIPHFYIQVDCLVDDLLDLRNRLNDRFGSTITLNDFVVRSVSLSVVEVPEVNVVWSDEALSRHNTVDIAVAVAGPKGGLATPVIRHADSKSIWSISEEVRGLADRARVGRLEPAECVGGCLTVSNLGMFGVDSLYAIINPPQSCILGIGAATQRAVVRRGVVEVGTVMTCTLSGDHRSLDGVVGARLLSALKGFLEAPALLLA